MTRVADSSFLIGLFNDNDRHHGQARHALATDEPIWLPAEVWTETVSLILRRQGFERTVQLRQWLDTQILFQFVFSAEREHRLAWAIYRKQRGKVSLVDAVGVAWSRLEQATLLTFDENQRRASAES